MSSPAVVERPYVVCPYHADLVPQLLPLLRETLGNSGAVQKSAQFWQWKHAENPFGPSYGLCAWDEAAAQAVGLRVLMRWSFQDSAGDCLSAVRAVDTATHPAYQRLGIFSALTRQAVEELAAAGVACIFNTPNSKSLPGYRKLGWQVVADWPLYLRPLRPLRMLWRQVIRRTKHPAQPLDLDAFFAPPIIPWATFVDQFGAEIENALAHWEAARQQVGLRTKRTLAYLDWRYGGHPHLTYGVYPATGADGRLVGFAILRPNYRYGWQETVLTELCLPGEAHGSAILLHDVCRALRSDYLIAHGATGTIELQMLQRAGFWQIPRQQITFTVRPLQADGQQLTTPTAWDLTLGDLELF